VADKKGTTTVEVEVDESKLGLSTRHRHKMATDQKYRDRALTPPGGKAPGEDGKADAPLPDGHGLPANVLADAAAGANPA
jgi:hypothetical protein